MFESQVIDTSVGSAFVQLSCRSFTPGVPLAHGAGWSSSLEIALLAAPQATAGVQSPTFETGEALQKNQDSLLTEKMLIRTLHVTHRNNPKNHIPRRT